MIAQDLRLLLLFNGLSEHAYLFADSLSPYFKKVQVLGAYKQEYNIYKGVIDSKLYYEKYNALFHFGNINDILKNVDIILGIDHGCLNHLSVIKKTYPNIKVGCQILDYPYHIINKNSKTYKESTAYIWDVWLKVIPQLDFIVYNFYSTYDFLKKYNNNPNIIHTYPVKQILISDIVKNNYIIYSGRMDGDKEIYFIIEALSMMEQKYDYKFVIITASQNDQYDYKKFASLLRVPIEIYYKMNEEDKYKLYAGCLCTTYVGAPAIPGLCVKEGMSFGKNAVVFGFDEYKMIYGMHTIEYADPYNIKDLSMCYERMFNEEYKEKNKNERLRIFKDFLSYDSWASSIEELVYKL